MNKILLAFKLMVLTWFCATSIQATIRYVKPGSTSTAWSTQTTVYNDLTAALTAAAYGDEIWVAAGTYKPTTGTDRTISFNLKDGVAVYGGFVGTETQLAQRNWVNNPTILSGDIGVAGTDSDNSYNVVRAVGTSAAPLNNSTRLDGVIIEKGYSNGSGGGAYLDFASPTIANTLFHNNFAVNYGGAMYTVNSNSVIANTLFLSNKANYGGAVFTQSTISFTHCTFTNNRSEDLGGAIFSSNSSSTTITNSIAWGNSAKNGNPQFYNLTCTYSCVEGGYTGTGNINSDPMFVDAANGDCRLNATSPCIDKGLNSATPAWLTSGFYGNARLAGSVVDMGIAEGGVATPLVKTPANRTVLPATTTSVALDWAWPSAQPGGITGYEIELQLNGGASQLIASSNMAHTLSSISQGSAYKWRVRGIDGTTDKNWSPWATFTIKHSTPLYVKTGGSGNGLSWATALGSLQTAINTAVYGDVIWVAAGTYKPTSGTDRNISFNLKDGVAIYGGFEGFEELIIERNWVANPTILSGDIGVAGTDTDNSYSVVKAVGTSAAPLDNTTRLDGVIIEKGYSNGSGGGAYLDFASPTIANTLFHNNFAVNYGGAMYTVNSNSVIANTLFLSNKANYGGAVFTQSTISFTHCTFANNRSEDYGGAVYSYSSSTTITNSIAWGNSAKNDYQQFYNLTCTYSCVEGGYTGTGNINSDPLFVDAANGDCRLNATSPCIDKGLNSATPAWLTSGFYGNARLAGSVVDMGIAEGGVATPLVKTPANKTVLPATTTSVALDWAWPSAQPGGITGYEIELQLNGGASQLIASSNMAYTLSSISQGSAYKWRVRGIDGTTDKNWSPWATFTVKHSTPLYVKTGGSGNGLSWATALGSLQTAINTAVYGDVIWVAAGTYKPTSGTDRNISFNLKDGVAIYGGFVGTETQLAQRNWVNNPTILSGDIGVAGTDTDNSYNVVKAVGTSAAPLDNTTRLDGAIVEKGYANALVNDGGGAYFDWASPIIVNVIFRNNFASDDGGAVYAQNSNSVIANTLFLSNKANDDGGAVFTQSTISFTHCTFANNRSEDYGGAVHSTNSSTTITNSIAWGNSAKNGNPQFRNATCTYSCVEGGYTGTGNIASAPLFVDAANGDCRLNATSPCIDKGLNSATPAWLTSDFYGNARLAGSVVDMGIAEGGVATPLVKTPANKTVLPATTASLALEWVWPSAQPGGITGYEIELQLNGGASQLIASSNMAHTLSSISQGSAYKWRVRGIDGTTDKNWSPWATFTVKHSTPLYVKTGGSGNGLSWATALGSLQTAINTAVYGDVIWVAASTYKPTSGTDRNISFNLKDGVAIYGGFEGFEELITERNWVANPTILSGDIGVAGTDTDNSYSVVKAVGTSAAPLDNTTRLDGVIVEKGYANALVNDGGGAYFDWASPIIVNVIFRNNFASDDGGAVYAQNSNSVIANTLFLSNKANDDGGAVYAASALSFTHCTFANNRSEYYGGAVHSTNSSTTITNSIAWGNSAKNGNPQFYNLTCTYSCVEGGYTGTGNIASDPLFVDAANGDYRLHASSPCIDKGLNGATPIWLTSDFYGNARLAGSVVDMGIAEGGVATPLVKTPANKTVLPATTTSLALEWAWPSAQPGGITGYEIELQLNGGASQLIASSNMAHTLSSISQGSAYKWRVRGIDGTTDKNWSPWATFTVKHSTPLYVKTGGSGNGLSWATALGSLQTAINTAVYGDVIWVAAGTYKPTSVTDRNISFNLKDGVSIYGGFEGFEELIIERNWVANPTILSGDIGVAGTDTDNSYSVVKAVGTSAAPLDNTTRLDGVIVEKGYANALVDDGGGAYFDWASPIIVNVIFRNNFASDDGGAVYAQNSNSVIANTLFLSNKANDDGGAVFAASALSFTHCTFANNRSEYYGGAVHSTNSSTTITNSIAWGNSAKNGNPQFRNATCTYSCVEGGYTGTGNINTNPLFVDAANGNFRLQQASPCINKALAIATPAWVTTDLDKLPRSMNGAYDMGAYEAAYMATMSPGNNQVHTQTAFMGSMVKWDIDPAVSNVEKQQITCQYELWKNGAPATIIAKGQDKGKAEVNLNPIDFGTAYQWRVGVKTAGHTYWSTPATFYIGRENPIYVKPNGTGDGSTWDKALGSVSSALEMATPGDRIWVAAGTYKPTGTGRDAAFKLKPFVELMGGFTVNDASKFDRNPEKNITILSGDLGTANDDSDNAYHVINNSYTLEAPLIGTLIDGFTITGGNAGATNGGGMLNTYANPTVHYCKFIDNKAASGGGIANVNSSPSIINSLLVKNTATAKGGAIYSDATSTPSIINNTIVNNSALTGGGISGKGTVGNTIVYDNTGGQIEGTPTVTYSCVQGGFTGTGNISGSPRFKDAATNNFDLGPFSSCFDKGNSNLISPDYTYFDMSFIERRIFVNSIDIGAYELKFSSLMNYVEVTQATPAIAATNINYMAPIVLTFNEPATLFDTTGITMASGIGFKTLTMSADKKTLTLTPSANWPFSSTQELLITNGAIRFADNTNFRMVDYKTSFTIRACEPATVSIDLLKPATCPGTLATLTAKTSGDVASYQWLFMQSIVGKDQTSFSIEKLTADSTGTYICNVSDMCNNTVSAQTEIKLVDGIIKPAIVKKWSNVYLVDNSSNRLTDYKWYSNSSNISSGKQYITLNNSSAGQVLYATALDSATGCVSKSDELTISSTMKSLSVYPNPVLNSEPVQIQLPKIASNAKVSLYDAGGSLKAVEVIDGTDTYLFDKTNFAPGVYMMEIVEAEEKTIVKLIIK